MKVVLDIEDNHASSVMEKLKSINYLHILSVMADLVDIHPTSGINKCAVLHNKLSAISKLITNWDNEGALNISHNVISISRILIDIFEEMELVEKSIYIHIFPTFSGGLQFELDGKDVKNDIEVLADENIAIIKYKGKENEVTELHYTKNNIQELKRNLL